jgi:L-lysine exporter family protein LysE/ArgO
MPPAFLPGFSLGLSLILAIGAQNAFVLRQGIARQHVFAVCLTCALSDALLIIAGVSGFGGLTGAAPWVGAALLWGGVVFLLAYGARSFISAWRGQGVLAVARTGATALAPVLATCLALTWLNPHVYLDTVVLLGSVAAQYPGQGTGFATGAATASFAFFFALGYGARFLAPLFARPAAWRLLDLAVGLVMWTIAAGLVWG